MTTSSEYAKKVSFISSCGYTIGLYCKNKGYPVLSDEDKNEIINRHIHTGTPLNALVDEHIFTKPQGVKEVTGAIVSTGGKSSYYELEVAGSKFEAEDVILEVFGNDFDMGNIFKSLVRVQAAKEGRGKAGIDIKYDLNKIKYTVEKMLKHYED